MDPRQTPTTTDLAKVLDSLAMSGDGHPDASYVVRWLIDQSEPAREIYDRLLARREGGPSLLQLAQLYYAAETGEDFPESFYVARWLIDQSPPAREMFAQLEQMAKDAGMSFHSNDWAVEALAVHEQLDRLLATLDDWRDADDVIDYGPQKDTVLRRLLAVCWARIARKRGAERSRLEELRTRLQDAARRHQRGADPEVYLGELQSSLGSLYDPAGKLQTVEELIRRLAAADRSAGTTKEP